MNWSQDKGSDSDSLLIGDKDSSVDTLDRQLIREIGSSLKYGYLTGNTHSSLETQIAHWRHRKLIGDTDSSLETQNS